MAAVAISDSWLSTSGSTCNLTSAPPNGTIVFVVVGDTSATAPAIHDSNSVNLTLLASGVNSTAHTWIYGYVVVGTPTAAYTSAVAASIGCVGVSGGSIATATSVTGTGTATSVSTSAMPNVPAGSVLVVVEANTAGTAYTSLNAAGVGVNAFGTGTRMGYVLSAGALTAPVGNVTFGSSPVTTISMVGVWPGPSFVQHQSCNGAGDCAGGTSMTNGNTEVVQFTTTATTAGDTVTDGVNQFTLEHTTCFAGNVSCAVTFDNLISGSPGPPTNVSISATGLVRGLFYEISGLAASGTNLFTGNTAASGSSVVATIAGVGAGDAQVGAGSAVSVVGALGFAFSNGNAGSTLITPGGSMAGAFTLATSTTSSTATYSAATSITNAAVEYADYVVPAPAPTTTPPPTFFDPGQATVGYVDHPGQLPYYLRGPLIAPLHAGVTCIQRWDGGDECWRFLPL